MKSFDKKTHKYLIDGKPATGVTTIIGVLAKPALIGWSARMAAEYIDGFINEAAIHADWEIILKDGTWAKIVEEAKSAHTKKKEAAGEHGTDTHALVEEYITTCLVSRDGQPTNSGDDDSPIRKFIDWSLENVYHFLFSERQMYNKNLFIAGTADFAYIGKDEKKYMADFKTSSGIYGIDYYLQVAAYRFLAESEGDTPYDGSTIVRLGKDNSFEAQHRFDYQTDKEAFLACLTLYRAQATYKPIK